jgi:hypothetical protein
MPMNLYVSALPLFRQTAGVAYGCGVRGGLEYGERTMAVVIDILLASCTFAFVTGIVIAAAKLVI